MTITLSESTAQGDTGKLNLYQQVAARMSRLISQGTFRPGERIPSVRGLSRQMGVSLSTVMAAYDLLENEGLDRGSASVGILRAGTVSLRSPRPQKRRILRVPQFRKP